MTLRKNDNERAAKLIIIIFSLAALCVVSFIFFRPPPPLKTSRVNAQAASMSALSEGMQKALRKYVNARDWVIGIAVMRVDFQRNIYNPIFRYFKSTSIESEWDKAAWNDPLFSFDEERNARSLNLLNAEMTCVEIEKAIEKAKNLYELQRQSTTVCMLSIPPFAGDFSGFIKIFLNRAPLQTEVEALQVDLHQLAAKLYYKDIKKCRLWC